MFDSSVLLLSAVVSKRINVFCSVVMNCKYQINSNNNCQVNYIWVIFFGAWLSQGKLLSTMQRCENQESYCLIQIAPMFILTSRADLLLTQFAVVLSKTSFWHLKCYKTDSCQNKVWETGENSHTLYSTCTNRHKDTHTQITQRSCRNKKKIIKRRKERK